MARSILNSKRLQIDKANATIVLFVAGAAFVTVFSLMVSKALLSQRSYQSRVIAEKTKALNQLKANNAAAQQLVTSYKAFEGEPTNMIGGSSTGSGDRDGDNAKLTLDALPSKYDFPALATSLEKILSTNNYKINSIAGIDDEVNQAQANAAQAIEMPFQVSVSGNFQSIKDLLSIFEKSIRPISISRLDLTGDDGDLTISLTAKTYFQPEKKVTITTKEVK